MARRSAGTDRRPCFACAAPRNRPTWRRPRGNDLEMACRIRISSLNHSEVTDPRGDGLVGQALETAVLGAAGAGALLARIAAVEQQLGIFG